MCISTSNDAYLCHCCRKILQATHAKIGSSSHGSFVHAVIRNRGHRQCTTLATGRLEGGCGFSLLDLEELAGDVVLLHEEVCHVLNHVPLDVHAMTCRVEFRKRMRDGENECVPHMSASCMSTIEPIFTHSSPLWHCWLQLPCFLCVLLNSHV
jgi:hypothetical protein